MPLPGCAGQTDQLTPWPINHPFSWRRFAALSNFRKVNTGCWPDLEWSFFPGAIWSNFFGFLWSAKTGGAWSTVPALAFTYLNATINDALSRYQNDGLNTSA